MAFVGYGILALILALATADIIHQRPKLSRVEKIGKAMEAVGTVGWLYGLFSARGIAGSVLFPVGMAVCLFGTWIAARARCDRAYRLGIEEMRALIERRKAES